MQSSSVTQVDQLSAAVQAAPMLKGSGTRKLGGRDSLRAFQRVFAWSLVALFVSLFPSRAHAYAWMIKHNYAGCPLCHADPSGGELLTTYGRVQSGELLRSKYGSDSAETPAAEARFPSFVLHRSAKSDAASGEDDGSKASDDDATSEKSGDAASEDSAASTESSGDAAASASTESSSSESSGADSGLGSNGFLWGLVNPPDWLLLGGGYRHLAVYRPSLTDGKFNSFPMLADVYGQATFGSFRVNASVGVVRVGVGSPYARAAQVTHGQGDQWNMISHTHWLGYDFADGAMTLRAGRLNLPFGVRIPEHTMWVRQATRTDRESAQQDGVALAYNGERLRGEIMAIAGNYQVNPDKYRERGYSLYAEYLTSDRTALGVSSLVTHVKKDRTTLDPDVTRQAHGVFLRSTFTDQLVLLAEADALLRTDHEAGYVGFAQLDFEVVRGLHLMGTGEVLDEGHNTYTNGARIGGAGEPRFGAWGTIDWFCLPHVEVRADVYSRQDDTFTALGQFHVFL